LSSLSNASKSCRDNLPAADGYKAAGSKSR
jgi:hypothetical protein